MFRHPMARYPVTPPSIADLQAQGVAGMWVTCCNPLCLRSIAISLEAIGLALETLFPNITAHRFVCSACGSRRADVSSGWREHKAEGNGRRERP